MISGANGAASAAVEHTDCGQQAYRYQGDSGGLFRIWTVPGIGIPIKIDTAGIDAGNSTARLTPGTRIAWL